MGFNFGKENVSEGGNNIAIFNNGVGGKVPNVSISIEKKGVDYQDEGKNKPDYNLIVTDQNGAFTREGYYYLNEKTHNSQFSTFDKAVEKQWNKLAAIVLSAGGDPAIQAANSVEMLDKMAVLIKNNTSGKLFNVFANYGTKQNPKKYLQVRSWVPFIEPADTTEEASKLKATNLDQIERVVQDSPASGDSGTNASFGTGWV